MKSSPRCWAVPCAKWKRSAAGSSSDFDRSTKDGGDHLKQAQVPEGAEWLDNPHGTAPGLWIEHNGTQIILLPGPPRELKPMFEAKCAERLARSVPRGEAGNTNLQGRSLSESEVDERIAPLYKQTTNPVTTLLASPGEIEISPAGHRPKRKGS